MISESIYLKDIGLNWLYIDINSYFATIEQQADPSLRGKPIVVVAVLSDATSAIAASYEAKQLGIKTGTKIYEAKKICPELICIKAKHELYIAFHKKIFAEVEKYLHVDHIFSIDEAACRLTGTLQEERNALELAGIIKIAIKKNVGEYISCSIGIAPNRYLAKIATDMEKPDGLVIIREEDIPHKLYTLKLKDLPGVGYNMHRRLQACGILTIERLYRLPPKQLRKIWGNIQGEKIWYLLRGANLPLEKTKTSSISHSQVLAPELRKPREARQIALNLLLRAAQRLRERDLYSSIIILSIKTVDRKYLGDKIAVGLSSDSSSFSSAMLASWDNIISLAQPEIIIKKVSIILAGLQKRPMQLSFEGFINVENKSNIKNQLLSKSIDKLNNRYGHGTVTFGQLPKMMLKRPPMIAFSKIEK